MSLIDQVRQAGVVGAGGGGFPTHIKLAAKADTVIANGAECEPLMHKDAVLMESRATELIEGMRLAMKEVGASAGIIGIKAKNKHAIEAVEAAIMGSPIRIHKLGDYYPAGDEYDLVYETTGRLIPPTGIPIQVGVVVCNVETFINIAAAAQGKPVTTKTLTVAGAVKEPQTMTVPIGVSLRECIAAAGGATVSDPVICIGGMMMGETTTDLDRPVGKTTGGVIVLPRDHRIIERKLKPLAIQNAIGKSACDQCRFCTEFCPRFLLGYAVEPHQVMRSLAFTATGADRFSEWATLCCSCGLCTLYACPEELYPKEACDQSKNRLRELGKKWSGETKVEVHPMRDGRRVPIQSLLAKLHIAQYQHPAPMGTAKLAPKQIRVPLKQGAGSPNIAIVKAGERVAAGQALGQLPEKAMGAIVHSPITGAVAEVTQQHVVITVL